MSKGRVGRWAAAAAATTVLCVMAAGCGGDDEEAAGTTAAATEEAAATPEGMMQSLGEGEGEVNLIAWAGYVEDGSTDPKVDWVSSFEEQTGCQVNVKLGNTSDEMVTLMRTGQYDGVSASGDASLRLIAGGDVAPVNLDLIPNYENVFEGLKNQPHNTVDEVPYGVPHGRGANLLQFRTDTVKPAPDSWSVVWDENSPHKGKVTAYDSPIYIADAAVYLMATQPDLEITDPYGSTRRVRGGGRPAQETAHDHRRVLVGLHEAIAAFTGGESVVGTTWQVITNVLKGEDVPVNSVLPKEGSTGWSDTWMIASEAKSPNCMYMWMNHIISPEANAAATEYFGEAPSNSEACQHTANKDHCTLFHADDEEYFEQIHYWKTPQADCGDDRGTVCKDYSEWTQAWTEIKG